LQIFTGIFTVEAIMKLLALGVTCYFKDHWNRLDITIVFFSLIELGLRDVKGLSILRTFRLVSIISICIYKVHSSAVLAVAA
jgi:Ion transport protein